MGFPGKEVSELIPGAEDSPLAINFTDDSFVLARHTPSYKLEVLREGRGRVLALGSILLAAEQQLEMVDRDWHTLKQVQVDWQTASADEDQVAGLTSAN